MANNLFTLESATEGYLNQIPNAGQDSIFLQKPFIKAACEVFLPTSTDRVSWVNMETAVYDDTLRMTCAALIDIGNTNELCGMSQFFMQEQFSKRAMEFSKVLTTLNVSGGCR